MNRVYMINKELDQSPRQYTQEEFKNQVLRLFQLLNSLNKSDPNIDSLENDLLRLFLASEEIKEKGDIPNSLIRPLINILNILLPKIASTGKFITKSPLSGEPHNSDNNYIGGKNSTTQKKKKTNKSKK